MPLTPTRNSNNKAPMAKKDIQKLGSNTLKGCHNNTSTQATLKPDVKPPCCPRHTLNIITAAIITARCVGKENPTNPAYSKAANKAGQSAKRDAVCDAGTNNTQHQRPIIHTSPATRLTCSPEIDIKCAVPLSRYWRHCSSSSQRRSATTSAGASVAARGQGSSKRRNLLLTCSRNKGKPLRAGTRCSTVNKVPRPITPRAKSSWALSSTPSFTVPYGRFSLTWAVTTSPPERGCTTSSSSA